MTERTAVVSAASATSRAEQDAVQGVAGALAFHDDYELFLVFLETAQHGIGDLAVHLNVAFPGEGVSSASPAGLV